jgi:hypothetical protein
VVSREIKVLSVSGREAEATEKGHEGTFYVMRARLEKILYLSAVWSQQACLRKLPWIRAWIVKEK